MVWKSVNLRLSSPHDGWRELTVTLDSGYPPVFLTEAIKILCDGHYNNGQNIGLQIVVPGKFNSLESTQLDHLINYFCNDSEAVLRTWLDSRGYNVQLFNSFYIEHILGVAIPYNGLQFQLVSCIKAGKCVFSVCSIY
jgi:hypothetical protein